jgi:queuine tRNA-ribosyltransferase
MFTRFGDLKMRNARHKSDPQPIDPSCTCHACAGSSGVSWNDGGREGFSRAYLHHLDRCGEMLGPMLCTIHNLHYYLNLMTRDSRGAGRGHVHRVSRALQVGAREGRLTPGAYPFT